MLTQKCLAIPEVCSSDSSGSGCCTHTLFGKVQLQLGLLDGGAVFGGRAIKAQWLSVVTWLTKQNKTKRHVFVNR